MSFFSNFLCRICKISPNTDCVYWKKVSPGSYGVNRVILLETKEAPYYLLIGIQVIQTLNFTGFFFFLMKKIWRFYFIRWGRVFNTVIFWPIMCRVSRLILNKKRNFFKISFALNRLFFKYRTFYFFNDFLFHIYWIDPVPFPANIILGTD